MLCEALTGSDAMSSSSGTFEWRWKLDDGEVKNLGRSLGELEHNGVAQTLFCIGLEPTVMRFWSYWRWNKPIREQFLSSPTGHWQQ